MNNNKEIEQHLQSICGGDVMFLWIDYKSIGYPEEASKCGHRVCCAVKIHPLGSPEQTRLQFSYAFSFCSPDDHFAKDVGRIVALRKLYRVLTDPSRRHNGSASLEAVTPIGKTIRAEVTAALRYRQIRAPRWAASYGGSPRLDG